MAQSKRSGGTAGGERVSFTKASAKRISDAVRKVEQGNRDGSAYIGAPRFSGGGAGVRYCEWTGTWKAGEIKQVTFLAGGMTATAINAFVGVDTGKGWVAKHSGTWHMLVCNLTTQPNYSSENIQVLGHQGEEEGIVKWFDTVDCDDEETS